MEFDEFMKIEGCKTKERHLFIGSGGKSKVGNEAGEEVLETIRFVCLSAYLPPILSKRRKGWLKSWTIILIDLVKF